ncbi:MAG: glycosyltransferase family 2 protein [Acidimicrobiales bacterium]
MIMPALNEASMVGACLEAIDHQQYPFINEIVVADGGSTDATRAIVSRFDRARIVDNPRRSRPAGLNVALAEATGDVVVRVDARTRLAPDYVSCCVDALESSGAAIVGGPMRFSCENARERGIAAAMMSRLGAGPAEFRRLGGVPRYVDTVYLGAYRRKVVAELGGYDEWSGGNEDAELAFRAQEAGGVYLDPKIVSTYAVREGLGPLARQFYRYGCHRARTVRKHPSSLSPRQLAVPGLLIGLCSPWRKSVLATYVSIVLGRGLVEATQDPAAAAVLVIALPVMHANWGVGFTVGLLGIDPGEF